MLGLVQYIMKERFHRNLRTALLDISEAVDGIDFAAIDGTFSYGDEWKEGEPVHRERGNLIVVRRDPVAVDAVGSLLTEPNLLDIPAIVEAENRGKGQSDISMIEIVEENLGDCLV